MTDRLELERFLLRLELQYFSPEEILVHCDRPLNGLPPRELWPNIAPTVLVLDEARHQLGVPLRLTSVYRAPAYNRSVGGRPLSQHPAFGAADAQPVRGGGSAVADLHQILLELRGALLPAARVLEPRHHYQAPAGPVPFRELAAWDPRPDSGALGSVFEFHGGLGRYLTFCHVDSRGLDHSWTAS